MHNLRPMNAVHGARLHGVSKKMPNETPKNTSSNRNEIEVVLLDVTPQGAGVFSKSANKTFWFARAEIPSDGMLGAVYSTIRLQAVRNSPFPPYWRPGDKVRVLVTDIKAKDGEGSFDVPA